MLGSGAFVSWYNGHPHGPAPAVSNVRSAVVIGNGNVALDVARILAKGRDELAGSDLPNEVSNWLHAQPIETIHIVGRRSAAEAKFNEHELAETRYLTARQAYGECARRLGEGAVAKVLRRIRRSSSNVTTPVTIHFHFDLRPKAAFSARAVEPCNSGRPRQTRRDSCATAVTCIGYESFRAARQLRTTASSLTTTERSPNGSTLWDGRNEGLRARSPPIAWRLSSGAEDVAGDSGRTRPGTAHCVGLLEQRGCRWVDYQGWRKIDARN